MRTLTIDISDSIYEHIMFFLKNLPSNLIKISVKEEDFKNNIIDIESIEKNSNDYDELIKIKKEDNPKYSISQTREMLGL